MSQQAFTLTSPSTAVTGLQYAGLVTLNTVSGTITTMEFVASAATISGYVADIPCHPVADGFKMHIRYGTPAASVTQASSGFFLYATELDYSSTASSVGPPSPPGPYNWTVASPPPGGNILTGDTGTLTSVTASSAYLTAASLVTPNLSTQASFC